MSLNIFTSNGAILNYHSICPDNNFSKALQGIIIKENSENLLEIKSDIIWDIVNLHPDSSAKQFVDLYENYNDSKSLYSAAYIYDYYLNEIHKGKLTEKFFDKRKSFVGEIGEFSFEKKILTHSLNIYQVSDNEFLEIKR